MIKIKKLNIIFLFLVIIIVIIILSIIQKNHHNDMPVAASPNTKVVAFISDAKPALGKTIDNLKNDFDQIKAQSSGNVSAIVAIGDMNPLNTGQINTKNAYSSSTVKYIPLFYVIGNHELNEMNDLLFAKNEFNNYSYHPNPGPEGSKETTYSFDVGDMHIIVLNEYWNGEKNGTCNWYIPTGGLNREDSCFKYSNEDGGFIPDALFDWLKKDLKNNTKKWTIVTGHEPLYPIKRQVGVSLDENKTNRDELEDLFILYNVSAFIGGHTHVADISKRDNIIHANAGVFGDNKHDGDNFASIIYTYEDVNGNLILEWRFENPIWINSGLRLSTIKSFIKKK